MYPNTLSVPVHLLFMKLGMNVMPLEAVRSFRISQIRFAVPVIKKILSSHDASEFYSGGIRFESRRRHRLSRLRGFVVFLKCRDIT
jgi:hypothetical protein